MIWAGNPAKKAWVLARRKEEEEKAVRAVRAAKVEKGLVFVV